MFFKNKSNNNPEYEKNIEKIREQLKALRMLGYDPRSHIVAGKKLYDAPLKTNSVIINHEDLDMSSYKYDSREEMMGGSDYMFLGYCWHTSDHIRSDALMPLEEFKKQVKSK